MSIHCNYTYRVREDLLYDDRGRLHTVYGIEVLEEPSGRLLTEYTVSDLFTERERAEALTALCNELELEPVHLMDVAEDALV